jgi:hypothetical protein
MYHVIKRTDQSGGYLAYNGHPNSYTPNLEEAKTFWTRGEAKKELCPENEIIIPLMNLIQKPVN